jgi:perosamine synthetase
MLRTSNTLRLMPFDCPGWPPRWPEIEAAARQSIVSGDWGQYDSVACESLEERLMETFQTAAAKLCCSGTAALEIALRASQIGAGDEVIVAAYDYPGNFRTIELLGARPVLIDVGPDSLGIDPNQLEQAAGDQVRAVVASHLCGTAADVARLRQCCDDRGWILIEDACQVTGMEIDGRRAGSFGHFATLSFGGSKLISAGNGGALLVNSQRLAARLGALLDRPGDTFPLAPLQAAVIEPQFDRLDEMNRFRRETVDFIEREVNQRLSRWRWQSRNRENVSPAFYKITWTAETHEHRQRIIAAAQQEGLPVGAGFRSMSRCSERRCGKPVPTVRSDQLSETLFVLDHRALLVESSRHDQLAECLQKIHQSS